MFRKILFCSDGSERSIEAASVAADLAKSQGAKLTLLHVCPLPVWDEPFPGAPQMSPQAVDEFVKARHVAVVRRTLPLIKDQNVGCEILEETGDPVEVIARVADNQDFDLIVLASRGLRNGKLADLGSVAMGVVQRVHCPVLIAK